MRNITIELLQWFLMTKGYAFGFLIILLVMVLGCYVAYTGFVSGRETLKAQPTRVASSTRGIQSPVGPTSSVPTAMPTLVLAPTVATEITATLGVTPTVVVAEPQPPASLVAPSPTAPAGAPQDGDSAPTLAVPAVTDSAPTAVAPPTPMLAPAHQFRLGGPPAPDADYPICCYIYGTVRDAAGNGLEGVQVQAISEWVSPPPAPSKGGNEMGKYDIPINAEITSWEVVLVDAGGNQISSKVQIQFDANLANGIRVDWQRTY